MKKISISVFLFFVLSVLRGEVHVYPVMQELPLSTVYKVEVIQNGETKNPLTYQQKAADASDLLNQGRSMSWAKFSMNGNVTIRITKLKGKASRVIVHAHSKEPLPFTPVQNGDHQVVEFSLQEPRNIVVSFDDEAVLNPQTNWQSRILNGLFIFAQPLELQVPSASDASVLYFQPGTHVLGTIPATIKTIYLAGGAHVKGNIDATRSLKIRGRGYLEGSAVANKPVINFKQYSFCEVEGITLAGITQKGIASQGAENRFRSIQLISWKPNAVGLDLPESSSLEDAFGFGNGDIVRIQGSYAQVIKCLFWSLQNGSTIRLAGEQATSGEPITQVTISDIDIAHAEWIAGQNKLDAVIGGGAITSKGVFTDWVIEVIRVYGSVTRLVTLQIPTGATGQIKNLTFRSIWVQGPQTASALTEKNWLEGTAGNSVENITFEGLAVGSTAITGFNHTNQGNFYVGPNTRNIRFTAGITTDVWNVNQEPASIYPSPASSYILLKNVSTTLPYRIFNATGRLVTAGIFYPKASISVSKLAPGVYFLTIPGKQTIRFLKIP